MKNTSKHLVELVQLAMLAAVSVVLVAFVSIPLVPGAQFLRYDMADVPILIATLLFGTVPGLIVLFITSTIQAFLFGGDGWVGLVMHFVASGALVALTGEFYRHGHKMSRAVIGMAIGTVAMTAIMIPMNYIFTVHMFGQPKEMVDALMLPGIIPFNFLKAGINSILAGILFKALQPFLQKNRHIVHQN